MAGDTMTQEMMCSKARMIYDNLKENVAGPSSAEAREEFKGSRGWFEKFKRRLGINCVIRHGEGASANKEEAEKFAREFKEWTIMHGYKLEQVFNCDETGLFWKQMPKRTFITKENSDIADKIVCLGKALHLEINEEDVEELVEEHSKDLTTEDLEELKKQLDQERDKEDKECSSEEEEDSNKKGRMP
jgi:hypothetical protein